MFFKKQFAELKAIETKLRADLWTLYCPDPEFCEEQLIVMPYDDDTVPGVLFTSELNDGNFEVN